MPAKYRRAAENALHYLGYFMWNCYEKVFYSLDGKQHWLRCQWLAEGEQARLAYYGSFLCFRHLCACI